MPIRPLSQETQSFIIHRLSNMMTLAESLPQEIRDAKTDTNSEMTVYATLQTAAQSYRFWELEALIENILNNIPSQDTSDNAIQTEIIANAMSRALGDTEVAAMTDAYMAISNIIWNHVQKPGAHDTKLVITLNRIIAHMESLDEKKAYQTARKVAARIENGPDYNGKTADLCEIQKAAQLLYHFAKPPLWPQDNNKPKNQEETAK